MAEVAGKATALVKRRSTKIEIPGKLRATSLDLPPELSWEAWERAGKILGQLRIVSQWAIGDWLNYGEHTYGEKYAQAADITGLNPDSLSVYQWVSSRIPKEVRHEGLSHAHHLVVAKLEPEDIQAWLDRAEKKSWSVAELRAALREKKARQARKTGDTESAPKFKVTVEFGDDPGEEFLNKLEVYVGREGGTVKKAGW